MNKLNNNKARMISATVSYCNEHAAETAGIARFAMVMGEIDTKMVLINALNPIASGTSKGVTTDMNLIKMAMVRLAFKCASATLAYANSVHNNTLKALVNFTESKLRRKLPKEMVDDVCESIGNAASAHIAEVSGYGISGVDITDLGVAIGLWRASDSNSRNAIITRSQTKRQVTKLIGEVTDDLLRGQLDNMVNTLKETKADFYGGYYQVRKIIDLGYSSTKVRGTVKDAEDVPLIGVLLRILEAGTDTEVRRVESGAKGIFRIVKAPVGVFDLEWSFAGYVPVKELSVKVNAGKDVRRNVVMEGVID